MAYDISFGGVEMPPPKSGGGLVITHEGIWSSNTGRSSAGKMMGTLVATKTKLRFQWNALSWEDAERIRGAVYGAGFTTCSYPGLSGETVTIEGYFGTPTFSQYSWQDGKRYATGIAVDFIER